MKHWKKGLPALVLCAALALGVAIPAFGSSGTVYLMAVNERVLDVTAENMPTIMGGVLYVPYTMLSIQHTGINLGVSTQYSATRRTVLVSDGQYGIVFDIQANTAQDLQGNPVPARAMVRNSMTFLPIDYLCAYFGSISCSRVYSEYGTVIRVTNGAAVLRDPNFVDAADSLLADSLRGYLASIATPEPTPPPTVKPTAAPTAAPTVPPTATPTAKPSVPPTTPPAPPSAKPSAPPIEAEVLLALRWGEQGEQLARLLEGRGERALFLFTVQELRGQDNGLRRLIAAGHTVGLALTGEDFETCEAQLEEGRRLLGLIARYHVLVVSADALNSSGREDLREKGCAVWSPDLRGEDYRTGELLVKALAPRSAIGVELECGAGSTAFLREALDAMDEESCTLRQVTAPLLSQT